VKKPLPITYLNRVYISVCGVGVSYWLFVLKKIIQYTPFMPFVIGTSVKGHDEKFHFQIALEMLVIIYKALNERG
jgi:hypothetical protein